MRQLTVTVPTRHRQAVVDAVARHDPRALRAWTATAPDGADRDLTVVELSATNRRVGDILDDLHEVPDLTVSFAPQSVLTLSPGRADAPDDLVDVEVLSPDEVFLAGLQSVGSWRGFLGYAAAGGAVVWIGLLLDSVILLIAAMLIAPFAGPAMNAALASSTGDVRLLGRTVGRYAAAIATTVAVAAALHLALGGDQATAAMVDTAQVSVVAVVRPLVAGAAGALNLMQAERSSLVPGAATGVLVAAALAPPAGTIAMAVVIGDWALVGPSAFQLALQLVGINLGGALVFRLFGLAPRQARYGRGRRAVSWGSMVGSLALVVALVTFQLVDPPTLQRSSVEGQVADHIAAVVDEAPGVWLVASDVGFARRGPSGPDRVLAVVHVEVTDGAVSADVEARLADEIGRAVADELPVVPLVSVTALVGGTAAASS
ncbi:MAG TPA: DUF389 domain-containing protein [Acidimicrobiales bacterium]|nr:DUF389 domain-containing protein [Acidimicrobiales bacterium]